MNHVAYIGLGCNIEPRARTLVSAMKLLNGCDGISVLRISQFIQTEPVGGPPDQPKYMNAAAMLITDLESEPLLGVMQQIEVDLGRDRSREQRWGPRTCDLDMLLFDDEIIESERLALPHPRMHERLFVLKPLAEIAETVVHPVMHRTIAELLAALGDEEVSAVLISIIGPPAVGKTTLAEWLAGVLPARLVREDYAGNPFLADFFLGRAEFALPAQMCFLFSRLNQLNSGVLADGETVVSDYGFCQDAVYAAGNLSQDDLAVYHRLAGPVGKMVRQPDVLIHLDGAEDMLLERIARRGRRYETAFTADFLASMREAYRKIVPAADCPVINIDIGEVDLRAKPDRAKLLRDVREAL
ncbi:MAG: 2-amino-4-hydroxy-6-hydroxymethyldihydropteridine diphosphokinase [Phycisphaerae bacterium]|nr:2-amino-4-hydroxy-6-hydroxymethyldihydropteridine diphosphokinase [Phycisphaerae bacterium]